METFIEIEENGIYLKIRITQDGDVRLLHFGDEPFDSRMIDDEAAESRFRLLEVHLSGENQITHHGAKHIGTMPGHRFRYRSHRDYRHDFGRKLELTVVDPVTGLEATSHIQFAGRTRMVRFWTELHHTGPAPVGVEYVSSFALTGIEKEGTLPWNRKMRLHLPHHTWYGEAQWRVYSLPELGLQPVNSFSLKRVYASSTGTWSSYEIHPSGFIENEETGTGWVWQIEHNGSWHWEIGDTYPSIVKRPGHLYLQLSGPTENENHWWKRLGPGERFVSVPVAVGPIRGGFGQAIRHLTEYRRTIRRKNADNRELPVIFNDYMNCLLGDPTTEKLMPLIAAAADAGCEVFCIDCGWYSDGEWWDGVGEWLPSRRRFPGGLKEVLDQIRAKGMVPGLWLEIEVMGIHCSLADKVPDDWFFIRHGKRVIDNGRYQLDFRNPEVVAHADRVVDRLVGEYGAGYIKMDYNINGGSGTEWRADSFGDGLLGHNRALLAWLDRVWARYPDLIIENCGSGGMRMDYAMLSRFSIQSSSDQYDYRKNAVIAAAAPTLITPEQCAVWSYPLEDGDRESTVFNMVNSLLMRVHQSGHLARIDAEQFDLVREALDFYKSIRMDIPHSLPFWPLGVPLMEESWTALGLQAGNRVYLAVWRLGGDNSRCEIPLQEWIAKPLNVRLGYPSYGGCDWHWEPDTGRLNVTLSAPYMARIFVLDT